MTFDKITYSDSLFILIAIYLQDLCAFSSIFWHFHRITTFPENRAVVIDIQNFYFHRDSSA